MKKSYKWLLAVSLLVLTGWLLYSFLFNWVVPKTAGFAIPVKWQMIPLRQTKEIAHDYLGEPAKQIGQYTDEWVSGSKDKQYSLRIYYVSDTIVAGYAIRYQYSGRLLKRSYLLDSMSIR